MTEKIIGRAQFARGGHVTIKYRVPSSVDLRGPLSAALGAMRDDTVQVAATVVARSPRRSSWPSVM